MTDDAMIQIERVRSEAAAQLSTHEIACERRYGEMNGRIVKIEALLVRNTWLLGVILVGMLAVAGKAFWPALFGG